MSSRIKAVVEGITLDLPSMAPQSGLDLTKLHTPFDWAYNYYAFQLAPRSLWVNGTCYGPVQPGDHVRLEPESLGKVFVNGHERAPDETFPIHD